MNRQHDKSIAANDGSHTSVRRYERPVYDSGEPGSGLSGFVMDRVSKVFGLDHTKLNPSPEESGLPPLDHGRWR